MNKVLLVLLPLISVQCFADYEQDMATLQKGMPLSVSKFIDRRVMCNHWGSEGPYDEERRKEINSAIKDLRCTSLPKDEKRLRKKFKSNPAVIKSINEANEYTP